MKKKKVTQANKQKYNQTRARTERDQYTANPAIVMKRVEFFVINKLEYVFIFMNSFIAKPLFWSEKYI